ncbi:protein phosphatase 2C domain-containing protein [Oerskovia flava]|uniref:protein phosphatase 2C domain-containing protein n=1 Tax=Oerskovia flava TaxID=2986422 RepID=UPI0022405B44|nr:protein phosphatase 2C domain-containing protein [Oerskovia sp. JB1-3-2]
MNARTTTLPPCTSCGEEPGDGARFCENCGADLAAQGAALPEAAPDAERERPTEEVTAPTTPAAPTAPVCRACGGTIADDGYCELCGEPAGNERDHWTEQPAPWVAGACDIGRRHRRNEDAMALAADPEPGRFAALVVCDGVSSAPDSDLASLAAARAARDVLAEGRPDGSTPVTGTTSERMGTWSALLSAAALAANEAIVETVGDKAHRDDPPSCTFVAAVVDGPLVVAGWIGDSRAYWLPDDGPGRQLSVDDSWAEEMVAQGMSREQADASPQAHAITRWLGPDAHDLTARTAPTVPSGPGWLVVCSDGLWNYCPGADDLGGLVRTTAEATGGEPAPLAAELVRWANAQGGRDNITVTLARFDNLLMNLPPTPETADEAPTTPTDPRS